MPRTVIGWLGLAFVGLLVFALGANLVNDPAEFFNVAFIGLTNGAVYALVALGFVLAYVVATVAAVVVYGERVGRQTRVARGGGPCEG